MYGFWEFFMSLFEVESSQTRVQVIITLTLNVNKIEAFQVFRQKRAFFQFC